MKRSVFTENELANAGLFDSLTTLSWVRQNLELHGRGVPSYQLLNAWFRTGFKVDKDRAERERPAKQLYTKKREHLKIIQIGDTQCKPGEDLSYMTHVGAYIRAKRPDVVVHIGDNWDFPSLSSYDKGKASFEGRRLRDDLEAGTRGMELLTKEILKDPSYKPRMIFCMGNHEARIDRLAEETPELEGFVGTELLPLRELGWEVYPFLQPVEAGGIYFVHYLANEFTGKPLGGGVLNQLKLKGKSFVVGHKQCLDIAMRPVLDGSQQIGIINGACYPFDEKYKGPQGNTHFRGIVVLHEVKDGSALPMPVSLQYLKERYERGQR